MEIQKIKINPTQSLWLVLDDQYLPIKPITDYLCYLANTEKSPNTIHAYANHLKLFWEFLKIQSLDWKIITLNGFAEFVHCLRHEPRNVISHDPNLTAKRQTTSINSILSAVGSFYRYYNQLGITDIHLTETTSWGTAPYKGLLYHIHKGKPYQKRIISLKNTKELPKFLTPQQVKILLTATTNSRDYFLVHLLFETGLRIGQALRLKHEDIQSWNNEIIIQPGEPSFHESQNKSKKRNIIHVSPSLMQSYATYLAICNTESSSPFVFLNLTKDKCLSYITVNKLFLRLSKKIHLSVTPHLLRHSHATELLRSGWDPVLVQKRLGHKSVQTTLDIYNHVTFDDLKKAYKNYLNTRGERI